MIQAAGGITGPQPPGLPESLQPGMTSRVIVRVIGPGEVLLQLSSPGRKAAG